VVREFRRQRADSFSTRRQYRRFLREYGQTTDDILFRVHTDMLSDRIREQIVAPVTVTDADVDAHLAEHGKPRVPERRDIRLILTRERSAAVAAKRELLRGATWSSVARRYSIDAATRRTKARLPNVARSWLERRLRRAVFGARPGRIIGPVRTRSGYYVVRVTRIHPGHDIADDVAREGARQTLLSQAQQAALDRFLTEYDAKWRARTACAPRWRSQRQCGG
jgi:foldase protein PrsA